jgi:flagellar hook-associated protein 1 FlgK
MSINHLLDIGRSALQAAQFGLDVTGNNIANVNTPNYTRQRPVYAPGVTVSLGGGVSHGSGVSVEGVQRIYDALLGHQVYKTNSEWADYELREQTYRRVESVLYPSDETNLGRQIDEFFDALHDLANNPAGLAERQVVLTKAETLASHFRSLHGSLEQEIRSTNTLLEGYRDEINRLASEIAALNKEIGRLQGPNYIPNEMLDRRDALIQELSGYVDPTVIEDERGLVTVLVSGGQPLVEGTASYTVDLVDDTSGGDFYRVTIRDVDITDSLQGGKIKGLLEAGEKMVGFQDDLDRLAAALIDQVNQVHTAGYDLDGNPGVEFFIPVDVSDPEGLARQIQVNISDPRQIAAAQELAALPGDNRNALALAQLRDAKVMEGGTISFGGFYQSLIGRVGSAVQDATRTGEAKKAVYESMEQYKDSISGVSLEEEEIRLLAYQHAYQAAAKFMSVVDDLLEDLLAL